VSGGGKIPDMRGGQDDMRRSQQRRTARHGSKNIRLKLNLKFFIWSGKYCIIFGLFAFTHTLCSDALRAYRALGWPPKMRNTHLHHLCIMKFIPFLFLSLALTGLGRVQAQVVYATDFIGAWPRL